MIMDILRQGVAKQNGIFYWRAVDGRPIRVFTKFAGIVLDTRGEASIISAAGEAKRYFRMLRPFVQTSKTLLFTHLT